MTNTYYNYSAEAFSTIPDLKKEEKGNSDIFDFVKPERVSIHQQVLLPKILISNIPFLIDELEDGYRISHETWKSLTVSGETLPEALFLMNQQIFSVVQEYISQQNSELTPEAIELKNYLIRKTIS